MNAAAAVFNFLVGAAVDACGEDATQIDVGDVIRQGAIYEW